MCLSQQEKACNMHVEVNYFRFHTEPDGRLGMVDALRVLQTASF